MDFLRPILDSDKTEFRADHVEKSVAMLERHFPFKMHDYQLFRFAIFYGLYEKGTDFPVLMKILICGVVGQVKMVLPLWTLFTW